MTDTYDKENFWFGWNGGERPVHAQTIVDTLDVDGGHWRGEASGADWSHDNRSHDIGAFRIVKLYREPRKAREWWVNRYYGSDGDDTLFASRAEADSAALDECRIECIHVREVLPEDDA
jgi:hypothetical protein